MDLTDERVIALLKPLLPPERIGEAIAYLDAQIREKGELISLGRKQVAMPFKGYFVFVDLMPVANWGHPALGVFISQAGDTISTVKTEFPPFFGDPPPNYRKLLLTP